MQLQQFLAGVILPAGKLLEAHRVGQIGRPVRLVYVQSHSDYRKIYPAGTDTVLYEYSADLLLPDPYVIGPLYPGLYALGLQIITDAQRHYGSYGEGIGRFKAAMPQQDRESEILPGCGMPGVVALTTPRRLPFGRYYREVSRLVQASSEFVIGGIGIVQPDYAAFRRRVLHNL